MLRGWSTTMAWLAAVWSLVYAGWHASAPARGVFGPFDVVLLLACLVLAALALRLARPPRDPARAHVLRVVAAVVGGLLLARAAFGVGAVGWALVADGVIEVSAVWVLYLLEGGLLFLGAAGIGAQELRREPPLPHPADSRA